jgi:hypothetical protein
VLAARLTARGLTRDLGTAPSRGGRRPSLMEFNARHGFVAGIDLGPTCTRLAIADLRGDRLAHRIILTPSEQSPPTAIRKIAASVRDLMSEANAPPGRLLVVGAGAPGVVDLARGVVVLAPNLKGWSEVPMREGLQQEHAVSRSGASSRYRVSPSRSASTRRSEPSLAASKWDAASAAAPVWRSARARWSWILRARGSWSPVASGSARRRDAIASAGRPTASWMPEMMQRHRGGGQTCGGLERRERLLLMARKGSTEGLRCMRRRCRAGKGRYFFGRATTTAPASLASAFVPAGNPFCCRM